MDVVAFLHKGQKFCSAKYLLCGLGQVTTYLQPTVAGKTLYQLVIRIISLLETSPKKITLVPTQTSIDHGSAPPWARCWRYTATGGLLAVPNLLQEASRAYSEQGMMRRALWRRCLFTLLYLSISSTIVIVAILKLQKPRLKRASQSTRLMNCSKRGKQ